MVTMGLCMVMLALAHAWTGNPWASLHDVLELVGMAILLVGIVVWRVLRV